jgi:hypothetical protein
MRSNLNWLWAVLLLPAVALAALPADGYKSPESLVQAAKQLANNNSKIARFHELAVTPGGRDLILLELGAAAVSSPAILLVANMEGNYPPASEAALELAELLVGDWRADLDSTRWFIVPIGNPDGYSTFFQQPLDDRFVNGRQFDADKDGEFDEDGAEDLNGDGYITQIRQQHPEGSWIAVEGNPLLMKRAENEKGEQGEYRLFGEGVDRDEDGDLNEDGPGGINPGHNFPHRFEHYTTTDGLWAASEVESRAILSFAFDHPEIAMVLVFGRQNTLNEMPQSSRKMEAAEDKYKVPERWANRFGLDSDKEYPIKDLLEMARDLTGYKELTEDMLLQWLGVGAAVNPDKNDLSYMEEISERYGEFIEKIGLDHKRLDPPDFPPGSVNEWAYYQFGVPTFSLDFWTLPEPEKKESDEQVMFTPEEIEQMSTEEFLALGRDTIAEFLVSSGAPAQYSPEMVMQALKGGMFDTKQIAKFMREFEKKEETGGADEEDVALYEYDSTAFIPWEAYDHPTLGRIEIGGMVPWRNLAPPHAEIDSLIDKQLPFVRELVQLLPRAVIEKVEVEPASDGVWRVESWVVNHGFLPYPTYQGRRCQRPAPLVLTISVDDDKLLEGERRMVLGLLPGSGGSEKVDWLIAGAAGRSLTLELSTPSIGTFTRTITLRGGEQ